MKSQGISFQTKSGHPGCSMSMPCGVTQEKSENKSKDVLDFDL